VCSDYIREVAIKKTGISSPRWRIVVGERRQREANEFFVRLLILTLALSQVVVESAVREIIMPRREIRGGAFCLFFTPIPNKNEQMVAH